jgi:S-adenosylmethionine decarboxylase proenzyme
MNRTGTHYTLDAELYENIPVNICDIVADAIKNSNMTIMRYLSQHFYPHGVTAVWILAESHATLHTYPESNYISVDVYTCGDKGDPYAVIQYLEKMLNIKSSIVNNINRGF